MGLIISRLVLLDEAHVESVCGDIFAHFVNLCRREQGLHLKLSGRLERVSELLVERRGIFQGIRNLRELGGALLQGLLGLLRLH